MTRRIPSTFAAGFALAVLGIATAPGAAEAEPVIAAQVRLSFGAGEHRLSLGLGVQEEQLTAQPHPLRPMAYRPLVEVSARLSTPRRRLEDLRFNGLPISKRVLYADEGEEESGDEASGGSGSKVALGVAGVAVGVLILGYLLADDFADDLVAAIDGI